MRRWLRDESGATAIEYALVASLIAVAIVSGLTLLRGNLTTLFTTISTAIPTR